MALVWCHGFHRNMVFPQIVTMESVVLYVSSTVASLYEIAIYIAQEESGVANIARGEAKCYICHKTLIKSYLLPFYNYSSIL